MLVAGDTWLAELPRRPAGGGAGGLRDRLSALSSALAPTVFVAGPLLLVWVTATGISLGGLQERQ
jgi:hypothetical protein